MTNHRQPSARPSNVVLAIAFLLHLSCPVVGEQPQPSRQNQVATFTVESDGDLVFIPVTFNGITGPFVLDAGASMHLVDHGFKALLGAPIATKRVTTAGSAVSITLFQPPRFILGQLELQSGNRPVAAFDLSRISEVLGRKVYGILGSPFFLKHVVRVDLTRGTVHVIQPNEPPDESWGVALPLHVKSNGLAYIQNVVIGPETMSCLLDTGMNGSIGLAKPEFERLLSKGLITSLRTIQTTTASGDVARKCGRIESVKVGPFEHNSIIVSESASENKIGLRYLSRFVATIDTQRRRIYLAPGDSFAKTDEADKSGLHLSWKNNRVIVDLVDAHSPAHRAGLIKGDNVLEVNGAPATGRMLSRIRRQFRGDEAEVQRLLVRRGGQMLEVDFLLQDYLYWSPKTNSQASGLLP